MLYVETPTDRTPCDDRRTAPARRRYTIVRPGGLKDADADKRKGSQPTDRKKGNIVMKGPDSFGLPPREQPGSILRSQVGRTFGHVLMRGRTFGHIL
eukprot:9267952-Pyramimonas_sp.AAC.1